MKFSSLFLKYVSVWLIGLVLVGATPIFAQDRGAPDSVVFEPSELLERVSSPLSIRITNDYPLQQVILPVVISAGDYGAFVSIDSVVFRNRMADPSVLDQRNLDFSADGVSPDTVLLSWFSLLGDPLSPGNDVTVDLYVTPTRDGSIVVDTGLFLPMFTLQFTAEAPGGGLEELIPSFAGHEYQIPMGTLPAEFTLPGNKQVMANRTLVFPVAASSPEGFDLEVGLVSMVRPGEPGVAPVSVPATSGVNPLQVSWSPDPADVGGWTATFEACNLFGVCDQANMSIEVIGECDVNGDGQVSLTDITELVNWLFLSGPEPSDAEAGDVNRTGAVNLTDITLIVNCLFVM